MSSSSDSEIDDNMKNFMSAVDTTLINDSMFQDVGKTKKSAKKPENPSLPSQRDIHLVENVFQSDINVSQSMQNFLGKKLSEMVANQVEFVDIVAKPPKIPKTKGIKLLHGAEEYLSLAEPEEIVLKRPDIKRRQIDEGGDEDEGKKLQAAVISTEEVVEGTKHWNKRKKPKVDDYKVIKDIGYLREPENEFTKQRKKNNWSESKIKDYKPIKKSS